MENIEPNKDSIPKQEDLGKQQNDRLNFLNDEKFSDIKEPLTKTINNLADEHIITPEEEFRNNIEQVTKDIFSDPIFDSIFALKEQQAQNIFLFRTKFKEIKKENQKNIKEEQTGKKEEQTGKKEEQTGKKEEQAKQEEEIKTELTTEKSKYYEGVMKMYEETESTYKIQDENLPNYKNTYIASLSEESKSHFEELSPEQQEGYLKARFAAEKIANEAKENNTISEKHVAFIEQFNELDKELNLNSQIDISDIPREKIEPKPSLRTMNDLIQGDNIGEELVDRNTSIKKFVMKSKDVIPDKDKEKLLPIETVKTKVIQRYPDKIEQTLDNLLKTNDLQQYKESFNLDGTIKDKNNIPETDRKKIQKISENLLDKIMDLAEEEQDRMIVETNEVIKTKAIETLVKNIGQYFQITNSQKGNFAENISIDVENGISLNNNMLTLSANMDGRDIGFYYDMNNGEVRADDFIAFEGESTTKEDGIYHIDRDKDSKGRERLPIKMETLDQILADSKSTTINNITKSMEKSEEPQQYRNKLSENTNIFSLKESSVGTTVIEHTMEKNTAVHNIHDFVTKYMPTRTSYGRQKEQYEYNLYKIIDTTFDRYTAEEIRTRNNLFQRFQNKINEKNPSFQDPLIHSLFDKTTANTQKEGNYDTEKGPNIYQFFQGITNENGSIIKEQVINLNLFEQIVNELESVNGNTDKLKDKSNKYKKLRNNFEEDKTKNTADNDLHLEDTELRGNST